LSAFHALQRTSVYPDFQISVALAGFAPENVELTVEQNVLTLECRKAEKEG
jgi:molecular chaperone IbpA